MDLVKRLQINYNFEDNMASPIDEPNFVETWNRCFAAQFKDKKLKNNKVAGENEITDIFLALAACEAIKKIPVILKH